MSAAPHKVYHKPCQAGVLVCCPRIDILNYKREMYIHTVRCFDCIEQKRKILGMDDVLQLRTVS